MDGLTPLQMLQRTYPGQLPTVRRDCFYLVLTVDFTDPVDVRLVADTMLSFVKRKLAIRIGLVPITKTPQAAEQAAIVYHLLDAYGLAAVISYLENSYTSKKIASPHKPSFDSAVDAKRLRLEKTAYSFEDALKIEEYQQQIQASRGGSEDFLPIAKFLPCSWMVLHFLGMKTTYKR